MLLLFGHTSRGSCKKQIGVRTDSDVASVAWVVRSDRGLNVASAASPLGGEISRDRLKPIFRSLQDGQKIGKRKRSHGFVVVSRGPSFMGSARRLFQLAQP